MFKRRKTNVLACLLIASAVFLLSSSSSLLSGDIWHVAALCFAPAFMALGVCEHSGLRNYRISTKSLTRFSLVIVSRTTLSQVKITYDICLKKKLSDQMLYATCFKPNDFRPGDFKPNGQLPLFLEQIT